MRTVSYNWQEVGLARALRRAGHCCDIVFFGGNQESTLEIPVDQNGDAGPIRVWFLRGISLYDAGLFFGLSRIAQGYDVIQVAEYDQLESWLIAGRFPEKAVVYHGPYHSDFARRYNLKCKVIDRLFLGRYKRNNTPFIAKSAAAESFLRGKGLTDVTALGVGLDSSQLEAFAAEGDEQIARKLVDLRANGCAVLLYIGKVEPRRNPYLLLDVMDELSRNGEKVHLVVVGGGDGSYVGSWIDSMKERGLERYITYIPKLAQPELPQIYRASDLFLFPTSYDIFGMVLLEAMYFGVPAVSTANGGSSTLIRDGANGIIVDSLDPREWASMVSSAISNRERLTSMGVDASRTIRDSYTWDALVPGFIEVYEKLLGR